MEDVAHGAAVVRSVEDPGGWSLECPAGVVLASGFRANGPPTWVRSRRGSKQERGIDTLIRTARRGTPRRSVAEEDDMFIIGIDPHRGSHTATVLDGAEEVLDELR
jgi:hypothetical protein